MKTLGRQLQNMAQQLAQSGRLERREADLLAQAGAGDTSLTATQHSEIIDLIEGNRDLLSAAQQRAIDQVLGTTQPAGRGQLVDLAAARASAAAQELEVAGPGDALTERGVLEDLLERHGADLDDQLRNLVVGFLSTLPDEEFASAPAPQGQLSVLAQVIALRSAEEAPPLRLDVDPELTPVSRADIEKLLNAHEARGHLLVALGAASPDERARLNGGEMCLAEFFRLAARGHFGDSVDKPISIAELDDRMSSAGLEGALDDLIDGLGETDRAALRGGRWSPRQVFTAIAGLRSIGPSRG